MYSARAWSIWNRSVTVAGACLAFGMLAPVQALAAHMANGESNDSIDRASASSEQALQRESSELDSGDLADPGTLLGLPGIAAARAPQAGSEDGETPENTAPPRQEVVTNAIGDILDLAGTDSATQPVESAPINARVPGVSDDTLARFKKRMYRQDI